MSQFISGGDPQITRNKLGKYLLQLRLKSTPQETMGDMAKKLQLASSELSGIEVRNEVPPEGFYLALAVHYNKPHENAEEVARCLHKQDILKQEMER